MIEFVHGDMFEVPADIRVNTVNCVGVMGTGVAAAFKKRYPAMFKDYQKACARGDVKPGRLHIWRSIEGDWVINFPTKRHWRDASLYEDIDAGLDALSNYLASVGKVRVALPALGCGHGGLDWKIVSEMIEKKLSGLEADIHVYSPTDSRKANKDGSSQPTEEQIHLAKKLGYKHHKFSSAGNMPLEGRSIFVSGKEFFSHEHWIALVPSLQPSEREWTAIQSLAKELGTFEPSAKVALIHHNRSSEEIARTLAVEGISVVLLVPFGVLTRKSLASVPEQSGTGTVTLISLAQPAQKWSPQLVAEATDLLRKQSVAMLLSASQPEQLLKQIKLWQGVAISYVLYEAVTQDIRSALSAHGAQAIARRALDATPKLDALQMVWNHAEHPHQFNPASAPPPIRPDAVRRLRIDFRLLPEHLWASTFSLIQRARPEALRVEFEIGETEVSSELDSLIKQIEGDPNSF